MPADVLEFQMRIAIREATDLAFVPPAFRKYARAARARHERPTLLSRRRVQRAPVRHAGPAELVRRRRVRAARRVRQSRRFWLIGAGLEGLYLWALSRNPRFPRDRRRRGTARPTGIRATRS